MSIAAQHIASSNMAKQPTLFNFFNKVPSPVVNKKETPIAKSVSKNDDLEKTPVRLNKTGEALDHFELCDIIWAKLDGYPWWPAMVCRDPDNDKFLTKTKVHVQFFDNPPSRAWVKNQGAVAPYSVVDDAGKRSPSKVTKKEKDDLKIACKQADEAFHKTKKERETLLVEFTDTPASDDKNESSGSEKENEGGEPSAKKAKMLVFDSDDDDEYKPGSRSKNDGKKSSKEAEMLAFDSDDDDEYKPGADENSIDEDEESGVDSDAEPATPLTESDDENTGRKRKRKNGASKTPRSKVQKKSESATPRRSSTPTTTATPVRSSGSTLQKLAAFKAGNTPSSSKSGGSEGNWPHLKIPFLQPDKIMDKNRRRPDDPEYDRRTLYVPTDYKNNCTPAMRQWWDLKSEHFDCVLFFKVGKFYELYHMDAVTGVNELSLSYMRGEYAHSGFPEIAYSRFSTILVSKGYKVARVEQMETPDMMAERCKNTPGKNTKFDKVVQREVCQVTTKGTVSHNIMDGEAVDPQANYLLALTEKENQYGVCFVDASIGVFHLGQFTDDKFLSRLRTLLSHCNPVQIIYEKKEMSDKTTQLLKSTAANVLQEALQSETEFWSATKTLGVLAIREELQDSEGKVDWPEALKSFISPNDCLGLTPSDEGELALRALGACIGYLQRGFLDTQLLAMRKFKVYNPLDVHTSTFGQYMVLDDTTLTNLEILKNSKGGSEGTLLGRLDRCLTFPGKRLLRQWMCTPLCNVAEIQARNAAVQELMEKNQLTSQLKSKLKVIPDLERLMSRIHAQGNAIMSKNHPDSRAIFFEEKIYSKKKIQDFLVTLAGFEKLQEAIDLVKNEKPSSKLLVKYAECPDLSTQLNFFRDAFDHELAKKEGCIVPKSSGVDKEYDEALDELDVIKNDLKQYLRTQCQYFGVEVKYFGSDKNRFQLEVSENAARKAGTEYTFTSSRKGYKRFTTEETKELLSRQIAAEESKANALSDLRRRIFAQFSEHQAMWMEAVQCMAQLDVLLAFADFATSEGETCLPIFDTSATEPFISVETGRHPCIPVADSFIPNSINMGVNDWQNLILLTGPNMGGKSTLLRQLGLHVVLAHMGCHLPAASAKLSLVDRIFTRIGAGDDILAGESTFYQELSETGTILHHATPHSIVLVDELGRGTSTYDGTAIAHAVVAALAKRSCRTIFSTHYHGLVEELQNASGVSLGHMACMAEGESITFLYQFVNGACPSSHGFHAARLAGLPEDIIQLGKKKAEQLDREGQRRQLFRQVCQRDLPSTVLDDLIAGISRVL